MEPDKYVDPYLTRPDTAVLQTLLSDIQNQSQQSGDRDHSTSQGTAHSFACGTNAFSQQNPR